MKPLEAPVWVRSHDLTRWILERVATWTPQAREILGNALAEESRGLVLSVSLALTFMRERPERVRDADRAIVRVRELLRLALELGFLPASSHRYAQRELLEIGRMVGGWRKRWGVPSPHDLGEIEKETGQGRCRPRGPRRELEERPEEVPVRVPEQEAPGRQERQPGLPGPPPPRPQLDGSGREA